MDFLLCARLIACTVRFSSFIMASTTKRADFEAIFPSLTQDILAHAKKYNLPANALEWFEKVGQFFLNESQNAQIANAH